MRDPTAPDSPPSDPGDEPLWAFMIVVVGIFLFGLALTLAVLDWAGLL